MHPSVQKYVDRAEQAEKAVKNAASELRRIAENMPTDCAVTKAGMGCACTGACRAPEYEAIMAVVFQLES